MKISGSILNMNKTKEELQIFENSGVDYVHLDVMDGQFVSNKSLPIEEVNEIIGNYKYDVHLMVNDVKKYIDDFSNINPSYITFHIENGNTLELIEYVKNKNIKVGLSINPDTSLEKLFPFLTYIDLVLIMSVEPGKGGQTFIENSLKKVENLYQFREENNLSFKIEIDGGINDKNIKYLNKCDIVVVGSFITNGNYKEQVSKLKEAVK